MIIAQIENGVVVNVIAIDPDRRPSFTNGWPEAGEAGPGWTYDGSTFAPPAVPSATITTAMVNAERNRRLGGTFTFSGKMYDCDPASMARITGSATLAGFAIVAGALPGNMSWHGGAGDFQWIAADNSLTSMDAQTCFAFGQAAAANHSAHIFAARALKEANPIPANFADDQYWP